MSPKEQLEQIMASMSNLMIDLGGHASITDGSVRKQTITATQNRFFEFLHELDLWAQSTEFRVRRSKM